MSGFLPVLALGALGRADELTHKTWTFGKNLISIAPRNNVPAIVARSKQVVASTRADLDEHCRWLQRHHKLCAKDLKRHQRRLRRRHVIGASKRVAITLVLLVPSLCMALLRGAVQNLISLSRMLGSGCSWIGAKARTFGAWLTGVLLLGCARIGVKARAFGPWLINLLSLGLTWIGIKARALGLWLIDRIASCFSWIDREVRVPGIALIKLLTHGFSRAGAKARTLGLRFAEIVKRQVSQLFVLLALDDSAREGAGARVDPDLLDLKRLQDAAFVRLRAEHERLQSRIHAISKLDGQRVVNGGLASGASTQEWVQLRALAQNAARLFETQRIGLLNSALSRASEAPNRLTGPTPFGGLAETRRPTPKSTPAPSARARVLYGATLLDGTAVTSPGNSRGIVPEPLKAKLGIGGPWSYARERLRRCWRAIRGGALMEHRAILPAFGVLAAALVLAAIGSQVPAADPSGTSAKDDGSAKLDVVADVADETRVSIVAKAPKSAPPTVSENASLDSGLGRTTEILEPLPSLAITVPNLMVMANFSSGVAAGQAATPTRVATPHAVTPKSKPKPAVHAPQAQSSWLRPSWLRLPWSSASVEADTKLGLQSSR
jgi:hypothetical protein